MNEARQRAFDNFAKHETAEQCDKYIHEILDKLKNDRTMTPSQREVWLEDLAGWIRHYRMKI